MKFKQYENGSCDIEFSWKERLLLFRKGKLHLSDENLKHFGNTLVKMVLDWQIKSHSVCSFSQWEFFSLTTWG